MITLPAVLTHDVAAVLAQGMAGELSHQAAEVVLDAKALTVFDSSALAVLLDARRQALATGKTFSVSGLPARLQQLAMLYGVAGLILSASAPT